MTFDKLADRCLLFVDTEKNLLIELLKEAEIEMSRKCNINEASESYSDAGDGIYALPAEYKQIIHISYNGDKLIPVHEDEVDYDNVGNIQTGTPTGYFIQNNRIHTNYKGSGGTLNITFYATVYNTGSSPIVPDAYHRDLCDYAIAIASAKKLPDLHIKHWTLWNQSLDSINNEDADRELVHSIKEVI
jgi:hypothetical protein